MQTIKKWMLGGVLAFSSASFAQQVPTAQESQEPATDMQHDHAVMADMEMPMSMSMQSAFGSYSMMRDGSGTSWQPDATPMMGSMQNIGDWTVMLHGYLNVIADRQTGPRGDRKTATESMLILMGQRPVGPGTFGLRAMLSLDPLNGKSGYPLLFQSGETANGRDALVDRQHPHDALMELAATYSVPLSEQFGDDAAIYLYGGLPGEPALGPPAFMHRFSGMRNPEAPLTHHWLDSTHITFGVVTLGASKGQWKLEASSFNGREPDQYRWNIETRKFDSWSTRLSYNPTSEWSMQVSYADLKSPEQLEPDTHVRRLTASASYGTKINGNDWQTTLAWGRNDKRAPTESRNLPGWLLESTYVFKEKHTLFSRYEQVQNDELIAHGQPLHGEAFKVRKLTAGYIYDFINTGPVTWGVGGLVGFYQVPSPLKTVYGNQPRSYMVFLQGRL